MKIPNTIHRFLFEDLDIRGAFVSLDEVWLMMQEGRNYASAVVELLGEVAATTVLIADNLKQRGRLTLQLIGKGPVSLLLVDCNDELHLRGMARAKPGIKAARLADLVGDGQLQLNLETPLLREPYRSIVPLNGNNVARIFEHYLVQSEQQPARLFLAAGKKGAAGLFLQKLPGANEKDIDGWTRIEHLAATVKPQELLTMGADELLPRLFPEENLRLFNGKTVTYFCPEDREKAANMLRSLGRAELESIYAEQRTVVIKDDICNHEYHFTPQDIIALLMEMPEGSSSVH